MDLILALLILAFGLSAGWTGGRTYDHYLVNKYPIPPKSTSAGKVKPECWCGHIRTMHSDAKDACLYRSKVFLHNKWHNTSCPCIKYDGPQPINEFYAPELEE